MHRAECDEPVTIKRKNPDGSQLDVECPPLLPDYQQYMRGVDRGDQLIGYYNIGRRSVKWWKRCFAHLLKCSLLNAYILDGLAFPDQHSQRGHNKRDYLSFRLDVAAGLVGMFSSRQRAPGHPKSSQEKRFKKELGHLPTKGKSALCVVCAAIRKKLKLPRNVMRHETMMMCSTCEVHLCIDEERQCYTKYHTLLEFC